MNFHLRKPRARHIRGSVDPTLVSPETKKKLRKRRSRKNGKVKLTTSPTPTSSCSQAKFAVLLPMQEHSQVNSQSFSIAPFLTPVMQYLKPKLSKEQLERNAVLSSRKLWQRGLRLNEWQLKESVRQITGIQIVISKHQNGIWEWVLSSDERQGSAGELIDARADSLEVIFRSNPCFEKIAQLTRAA
jgi:hypothetical protein